MEEQTDLSTQEPSTSRTTRAILTRHARGVRHQYLFDGREANSDVRKNYVTEGEIVSLPFFDTKYVLFPGETFPIIKCEYNDFGGAENRSYESYIDVAKNFTYVVLRTKPVNRPVELMKDYATVGEILRYSTQPAASINIEVIVTHRCKIINVDNEQITCLVHILPEYELPSVPYALIPKVLAGASNSKKSSYYSNFTPYPQWMLRDHRKEGYDKIVKYCSQWYSKDKLIDLTQNMDPVKFSFWACINVPLKTIPKMILLTEDSADSRIMKLCDFIDEMPKIFCCRSCGNPVLNLTDTVEINSTGIGTHYVNSHGYTHSLLTVCKVQNVRHVGGAQEEFSWYPGYAWQILTCRYCEKHLGWKFTSKTLEPEEFYGISMESVSINAREHNISTDDDEEDDEHEEEEEEEDDDDAMDEDE